MWRVKLVADFGDGAATEIEVARIERQDWVVPETLGLTLAEGKRLTSTIQTEMVRVQPATMGEFFRCCGHCGSTLHAPPDCARFMGVGFFGFAITNIRILILLLAVVAAAAVVASRSKIPAAILLVLIGLALSLAPGLPAMELAPEFVLLLVLPPVIYSSAFNMSWREFRFNLRPITLLSVGGVLFTAVAVAAAAPDSWALIGPSASCSARSSRRPTPWLLSPLRAAWGSLVASSSFWKAKGLPTTPRR